MRAPPRESYLTKLFKVVDAVQTGLLIGNVGIQKELLSLFVHADPLKRQIAIVARFNGARQENGILHGV
jgi:hypothetical protein